MIRLITKKTFKYRNPTLFTNEVKKQLK